MKPTNQELNKIYLEKTKNINSNYFTTSYLMRHMIERNWNKFDEIWIKYKQNKATFEEWENALDKWLKSEQI